MTIPYAKGIMLARLAIDILSGDRQDAEEVAKELAFLAIDMLPVDKLRPFLTDLDRKYADLAADVAEEVKLSETKP